MTKSAYGFIKDAGPCSVAMWSGGLPSGCCGNDAYGVQIEGAMRYHAPKGYYVRDDNKFAGFAGGLACPVHSGPEKYGPRVFEDGTDKNGKRMWCAVYEDFENLQESPAEFHTKAWVAVDMLTKNHPRT